MDPQATSLIDQANHMARDLLLHAYYVIRNVPTIILLLQVVGIDPLLLVPPESGATT